MKNAVKCGVADQVNNKSLNPRAHKQLRKFMSLQYLPGDNISESSHRLVDETREMYSESNVFWESFFQYFQGQWITKEKPKNFSTYGLLETTNNIVENYHRDLRFKLGVHAAFDNFFSEHCRVNRTTYTINNYSINVSTLFCIP